MNTKIIHKLLATFLILTSLLVSFAFPKKTSASENFENSLKTTYTVHLDGKTFIEHEFTIKNLTPEFFISKYGLQLSSPSIKNVTATSNGKEINAEVVTTKNQTSIGLTFPDKVVGEHKVHNFSINYQNEDLAQINGKVLEVSIPQLTNPSEYNSYEVSVHTPIELGAPTRVTPDSYTKSADETNIQLNFTNLNGKGISVIYGTEQVFDLNLKYSLENEHNQPVLTQITLPPDTSFQKLYYEKINPTPNEIEIDEDGNWIATYRLESYSNVEVSVHALARITLDKDPLVPVTIPSSFHLAKQEFWETNNSSIQELASQYPAAEDIYTFTTQQLSYTTEPLTLDLRRLGAVQALENSDKATCQEFTDVFITLSRINQIPTRRITGYAYTKNETLRPLSLAGDILHAWPEYYNNQDKTWVGIDPTWGSTTGGVDYFNQFDLNHVAFAINGKSSTLPYPAGSYKENEEPTKNVSIEFGESFPIIEPSVQTQIVPRQISFLKLPGAYELIIANETGLAWYDLQFDILSNDSSIQIETKRPENSYLLPFQKITIPFKVYNDQSLGFGQKEIIVAVSNNQKQIQTNEFTINTLPSTSKIILQPAFVTGLVVVIIIITLIAGSLLVFRRKR